MAIQELDNLREKYPQYNDMDDATLANALVRAHPEYSDIRDQVAKTLTPEVRGGQANKAESNLQQLRTEASPAGFAISQGLNTANRAINTATMNAPEIIANKLGTTTYSNTQADVTKGIGEGIGFVAPGGAPATLMKGAEAIAGPVARGFTQGASAMASQLPTNEDGKTDKERLMNYGIKTAAGGVIGVLLPGVGHITDNLRGISGRMGNWTVKLPVKAFRYGKDPLAVMAEEKVTGNTIHDMADGYAQRLEDKTAELKDSVANSDKTVDLSQKVNDRLNQAAENAKGSLQDRQTLLGKIDFMRNQIQSQYGDLSKMSLSDAVSLKRQLADDFPFTVTDTDGNLLGKVAHQLHHDINGAIDEVAPEVGNLNDTVSSLIDISKAAKNRAAIESRQNPLGLVGSLAALAGIGGGLGFAGGHNPQSAGEGVLMALALKAGSSPAVMSRLAAGFSTMADVDKIAVAKIAPWLTTALERFKTDPESAMGILQTAGRIGQKQVSPESELLSAQTGPKYANTIEPKYKNAAIPEAPKSQPPDIAQWRKASQYGSAPAVFGLSLGNKNIDMNKIYDIESSNNDDLIHNINNKKGQRVDSAVGIGQVKGIGLKQWNQMNPKEQYSQEDLLDDPEVNKKVSNWIMNIDNPRLLKSNRVPDTETNRIVAYNRGAGKAASWYKSGADENKLPQETKDYLKKYRGR